MTSNGRPDYDAGDLVVHIGEPHELFPPVGSVWTVEEVWFGPKSQCWGVSLVGFHVGRRYKDAAQFRRIDPKPPEFWTGTVDADANEKVPA